jgi:hypothetical protein
MLNPETDEMAISARNVVSKRWFVMVELGGEKYLMAVEGYDTTYLPHHFHTKNYSKSPVP